MPKIIAQSEVAGKQFGKITLTGFAEPIFDKKGYAIPMVWGDCQCGTVRMYRLYALRHGTIKSCGCSKRDRIKHGHARRGIAFSKEYKSWRAMTRRCTDTKLAKFKDYGGRGITVCDRWLDFKKFQADMGKCPEGCTLHRKNNDKGYNPDNCKWADAVEQAQNKTTTPHFTVRGVTGCLTFLCRHFGVRYQQTLQRTMRGWPLEAALFTPRLWTLPIEERRRLEALMKASNQPQSL